MRATSPRSARGSSLVFTVVLLAVLSVIGAAAVALSAEERISASEKSQYAALVECANAAQAKLWADMGLYGMRYQQIQVSSIKLPNGMELVAPAHYGWTGTPAQTAADVISIGPAGGIDPGGDSDATNRIVNQGSQGTAGNYMTARCKDAQGREHEVEVAFKFAL